MEVISTHIMLDLNMTKKKNDLISMQDLKSFYNSRGELLKPLREFLLEW